MSFYTSYKFRFWRYLVTWSWWLSHHDTWWPVGVDVEVPGDKHVAAHPLCPVGSPATCLAATALKYKLWNLWSANHIWQVCLKYWIWPGTWSPALGTYKPHTRCKYQPLASESEPSRKPLKLVLIAVSPQTHLKGARPQGPSFTTWGLWQGLEQGE